MGPVLHVWESRARNEIFRSRAIEMVSQAFSVAAASGLGGTT